LGDGASIVTYNSALQALAKTSQPIDRVAQAIEIRKIMSERGVHEDKVTITSLLSIYGDSPLAEELLEKAKAETMRRTPPVAERECARDGTALAGSESPPQPAVSFTAHDEDTQPAHLEPHPHDWGYHSSKRGLQDSPMPDMAYATSQGKYRPAWLRGRQGTAVDGVEHVSGSKDGTHLNGGISRFLPLPVLQTDLRGLTRPAAVITLRNTLRRAAEASARGEAAGGGWEIITRTPGRGRRPRNPEETLDHLVVTFLRASGMRYQRQPRGMFIDADGMEQAAAALNVATRTQAVIQGSILRIGIAITTIAAVSLIPRLTTML